MDLHWCVLLHNSLVQYNGEGDIQDNRVEHGKALCNQNVDQHTVTTALVGSQ